MQLLVTGASGFIGRGLTHALQTRGHVVIPLVRVPPTTAAERFWQPDNGTLDPHVFDNIDAVIHLGGESISSGRWTAKRKKRLYDSRIHSTRLLVDGMRACMHPPKALVCASAIGYYGDRGNATLQEDASPGSGFLADLCVDWEKEAARVQEWNGRWVSVRTGIVLSPTGGALPKMLIPFHMGLGGPLVDGRQWMSWISYDDIIRLYVAVVENDDLHGPVNGTAPNPVTNATFTRALANAIHRPAFLRVPRVALRIATGEMGDALLLSSANVRPQVMLATGFSFQHERLQDALSSLLPAS